jgi:hypothetical protein
MCPAICCEPARSRMTRRPRRKLITRNIRHAARPGAVVGLLAKGDGR